MRTNLDFSPLFRSSIGFDRMLNALEAASRAETSDSWPPYDIVKAGENDYRIVMAVAGFSQDEKSRTCSSSRDRRQAAMTSNIRVAASAAARSSVASY
jgi:hypothetical protein